MFDSSWTKGPSMKGARSVHGCTVFDQSLVIVAGGWNDGTALSSVEILDPNMNQWVPGENERDKTTKIWRKNKMFKLNFEKVGILIWFSYIYRARNASHDC